MDMTKEQISLIMEALQDKIVSYNQIIQKCILKGETKWIPFYESLIDDVELTKKAFLSDLP